MILRGSFRPLTSEEKPEGGREGLASKGKISAPPPPLDKKKRGELLYGRIDPVFARVFHDGCIRSN